MSSTGSQKGIKTIIIQGANDIFTRIKNRPQYLISVVEEAPTKEDCYHGDADHGGGESVEVELLDKKMHRSLSSLLMPPSELMSPERKKPVSPERQRKTNERTPEQEKTVSFERQRKINERITRSWISLVSNDKRIKNWKRGDEDESLCKRSGTTETFPACLSSSESVETANISLLLQNNFIGQDFIAAVIPNASTASGHSRGSSSTGSSSSSSESSRPPIPMDINQHVRQRSFDSALSIIQPFAGSSTKRVGEPSMVRRPSDFTLAGGKYQPEECSHGIEQVCSQDEGQDRSNMIQWRQVPGTCLKVRSDNYEKSRSKIPSLGELYECLAVDVLHSEEGRIPDMCSKVELPEVVDDEDDCVVTWDAPDVFVVTLSIPLETKGNTERKPTLTVSMYFGMKPETREILKVITCKTGPDSSPVRHPRFNTAKVNAARLFDEWCRRSPRDPAFQGRFKVIPYVANLEELGVPGWISRWNAKPILIKRSGRTGFVYRHHHVADGVDSVMEMEISFHPFPWAFKQAIEYLRRNIFHKVLLTLGFVIEAREESEFPEVLIGLTQLCFPKADLAVSARDFFLR